jgi:hypothetical protein
VAVCEGGLRVKGFKAFKRFKGFKRFKKFKGLAFN